jgi:hypothetical protein
MRDEAIGLAQDSLDRQREAEEAFETVYNSYRALRVRLMPEILREAFDDEWATIAREMGITSFYKRLKEGK